MHVCRPFEPPPDYPLDPPVETLPSSPSISLRSASFKQPRHSPAMLRTRQFPEIAGLSKEDALPSLRGFSKSGPSFPLPISSSSAPVTQSPMERRRENSDWMKEGNSGSSHSSYSHKGAASSRRTSQVLAESNFSGHQIHALSRNTLRKSCPDLERELEKEKIRQRLEQDSEEIGWGLEGGFASRTKKARQKRENAEWMKKDLTSWSLDDVILWMQHIKQDEVASLLFGYDIKGKDLLSWNDSALRELGVKGERQRSQILSELQLVKGKPERRKSKERVSLFDIIQCTAGDKVLVVECALTVRDISVGRGKVGCLSVTKVNGTNLPLKEEDVLLEINNIPGDRFKSALMLTKLISDSGGEPIRFVILRKKETADTPESISLRNESSSGVSSSSPASRSI